MNYEIFSVILPLPTGSTAAICSAYQVFVKRLNGEKFIALLFARRTVKRARVRALNYEEKEKKDAGNVLCFCTGNICAGLARYTAKRNLSTIDRVIETRIAIMTYIGDKN
jgi:hypothetical protein